MIRATFSGFYTALSALQSNQKRLDIVGQNLSNMHTMGYTRQQLDSSSLNYSNVLSDCGVGFGVSIDGVSQLRDPYLDSQYRTQMGKAGYPDAFKTALDRLSYTLDESKKDGIRQAFDDIQSTFTNMQDKANDPIYESELRSRMQSLANLLNDAARQIRNAQKAEIGKLDGSGANEQGEVQKVNDLLRQIGDLNHRIKDNQIQGESSLELLDERNRMLDELSSYVPIEVSYFKDAAHDGKKLDDNGNVIDAPEELYEYDSKGNIIGKKNWPDDLKVELVYKDADGTAKRLTLVDGTEGKPGENYGSLSMSTDDPSNTSITFTAAAASASGTDPADTATASGDGAQLSGGSIQASLDMLDKSGDGGPDDVRGYQYYMNQLNKLAAQFADTMNSLNEAGGGGALFANKDDPDGEIDALTISISKEWINGTVHISTGGDDPSSTILNMLEAMSKPQSELGDKSFADFINNVSTILANDSSSNANTLKTNVTVLNGIQDSRDSISAISLDEEATNMMSYVSAYNAASRLMTTLDEALNTLISSTGLVGR